MKKLLLSLVVFSVLFVTGCQENNITDPLASETINKNQLAEKTNPLGYIPLEGLVSNLNNPEFSLNINGIIEYEHELVIVDPIPPAPQYYVSVHLSVQAALSDTDLNDNSAGVISGASDDIIYVSEEGIYILDKQYEVEGLTDGLVLVCRFLVTTDGIGLHSMWLYILQD